MNSAKPLVDPDGARLPIKLDTTSNGEFEPVPLSPMNQAANRLAHEAADKNSKRLAVSRRNFLISACGAASTLLTFNAANAAAGKAGGFFDLPIEAALEQVEGQRTGNQEEYGNPDRPVENTIVKLVAGAELSLRIVFNLNTAAGRAGH